MGKIIHINPGDKIGLVGRNGAGKTTTITSLAGISPPFKGKISTSNPIGFLPQDTKINDLKQTALMRILSAKGLVDLKQQLDELTKFLAENKLNDHKMNKILTKYGKLVEVYELANGYSAENSIKLICNNLGLATDILNKPLNNLSGGQKRRVELARILFAADNYENKSDTILFLDEPTNHLDMDSISWLQNFLQQHAGGLVIISHDEKLLANVVNQVWFLNTYTKSFDVYKMSWKQYLITKNQAETRLKKEAEVAFKKATALKKQAAKFSAKATKAIAAKNMLRRADRLIDELSPVNQKTKTAKIVFPIPLNCGISPLRGKNITKVYGTNKLFSGLDLEIERGSKTIILGLNGTGKTTLLKILAGVEPVSSGKVIPGSGLKIGYFAQEHDDLDVSTTLWDNITNLAADIPEQELRNLLGGFLFSQDKYDQIVGTMSGGEKTRLSLAALVASKANVLLLDEPTNNLDVDSRDQVLTALRNYQGAIILVSHDPGAVKALSPEKVLLLPDGIVNYWGEEYEELIELA